MAGEPGLDADALLRLTEWVEVESPTSFAAGVDAMMDMVAADADAAGIAAERLPGRDGLGGSVIMRAGPRPATGPRPAGITGSEDTGILVLSHLDTVHPVGTLARDLPVRQDGDRLYGPGVFDMKAGAFLAWEAFKRVARDGSARRPITFLFTPDEEIGSPTTRTLIEDLGRRASAVLVTEPARPNGGVVTSRKGVGRFEIQVEGRPSHAGARHPDGRSAIREAALQVTALEALTDYARGVTTNVGVISGGTADNVVPQHCRFTLDLRVVSVADGEDYTRRILGLRPVGDGVTLRVEGGMNRPPYEAAEPTARLYARARDLAAGIGFDLPEAERTGGGSDGNFTAALGIATLDGLGVAGDGAHTLGEYALLSSIPPRQALMAALLRE